jgi:hypothetical protein
MCCSSPLQYGTVMNVIPYRYRTVFLLYLLFDIADSRSFSRRRSPRSPSCRVRSSSGGGRMMRPACPRPPHPPPPPAATAASPIQRAARPCPPPPRPADTSAPHLRSDTYQYLLTKKSLPVPVYCKLPLRASYNSKEIPVPVIS